MKSNYKLNIPHKFDVRFGGEPSINVKYVEAERFVGLVPRNFNFIKPKVVVKIGDIVKRGQGVLFDKKNPQMYCYSPITGTVVDIVYGPQRRLDLIKIERLDDDPIEYSSVDVDSLNETSAKSALLERGLWPYFLELPFNNVPTPDKNPPAIIVSLSNNEPFHPKIGSVLNQFENDMIAAVKFLKKLCPTVVLVADADEQVNLDSFNMIARVVRVSGKYPSLEPGSVLYHLKDSKEYNNAWVCDWNFLIKLGKSLDNNQYYGNQVMIVGGNQHSDNQHYVVTDGIELSAIFRLKNKKDRVICGGLLNGLYIDDPGYLPIGIDAINIIDNDPKIEFMSFMQLGAKTPSYSTAYLSGFLKGFVPVTPATDLRGGARDCISCGYCEEVCPVEAMPQQILKHETVNDVEEMMRFGVLDCSECGACTYVCPSKIELGAKFVAVKHQLYKESTA